MCCLSKWLFCSLPIIALVSCQTINMTRHTDYSLKKDDSKFDGYSISYNGKNSSGLQNNEIVMKGHIGPKLTGLWTLGSTTIKGYQWVGKIRIGNTDYPMKIDCSFSIDKSFGKEISNISLDMKKGLKFDRTSIGGLASKIPFSILGATSGATKYVIEATIDPYEKIEPPSSLSISHNKLQTLVFSMQKFQILDTDNELLGEIQGNQCFVANDIPEDKRTEVQILLCCCRAIQALGQELIQLDSENLG